MRTPSRKSGRLHAGFLTGILACVILPAAWAQQPSPNPPLSGGQFPIPGQEEHPPDPMQRKVMREASKQRNVERQQRLEADTKKLVVLAQQLQQEVGVSNKDTLSVAVVKKAEEIEKLARNVKERMKGPS